MSLMDSSGVPVSGAAPMSFVVSKSASSTATVNVRRFTIDEYHRMEEAGMLKPGDRVELLEGIITMMSPIGPPHAVAVELLSRYFARTLPDGWTSRTQHPILTHDSEPQPDCCIVKGALTDYRDRHPDAREVLLVIEVSESTLTEDREVKARIYAASGIPEYWIVNLVDRTLEVRSRPIAASGDLPARYESVDVLGPEATVDVMLDGSKAGSILVAHLIP